ncbi:MAG: hypothetical protein FWG10_01110 [Eubacteriaceae bacterium]|nr:hypothetical protein [Eubacteriaceae bacterium]
MSAYNSHLRNNGVIPMDGIQDGNRQDSLRLYVIIILELASSAGAIALFRESVKTALLSWFLFAAFLSLMLFQGKRYPKVIFFAMQVASAITICLVSSVEHQAAPFACVFLVLLYSAPLWVLLRRGSGARIGAYLAALAFGYALAFFIAGGLVAAMLFLPVSSATRAILLLSLSIQPGDKSPNWAYEAAGALVVAIVCIAGPALAEPSFAAYKVKAHLKRQYEWQEISIAKSSRDSNYYYMDVQPSGDLQHPFTVRTGRGLSSWVYDDYMSVVFLSQVPGHYYQLLDAFPIKEISTLVAPQSWDLFYSQGMGLEQINEARFVRFTLGISFEDSPEPFEDIASLIVDILGVIRSDFLAPEIYFHFNGEQVYFNSVYVDTSASALKDLPSAEEVRSLIEEIKTMPIIY